MKKSNTYKVLSNAPLTRGNGRTPDLSVWKMVLEGDTSEITAPGQFVNIGIPGRYLRRPISICMWDERTITLVYRVVGGGTLDMSLCREGDTLNLLTGLGNGFSLKGKKPVLVGGGVGVPPMVGTALKLREIGVEPIIVAGFNSASDAILIKECEELGLRMEVATLDGSLGTRGTVMEVLKGLDFDCFYACGPKPMLKALSALPQDGQVSVEERMGCGVGVCMGCTCMTEKGIKRVCKDGPVFDKEDMKW